MTVSSQLYPDPRATFSPFERRCAPRIATRLTVGLNCQGLAGKLRAISRDLGSGGICVETPGPFDLSSLRSIELPLPGHSSLHLAAEGLWQRDSASGTGVLSGVSFQGTCAGEEWVIEEFVLAQAKGLADFLRRETEIRNLAIDDAIDLALCTRFADYPVGGIVYAQNEHGTRNDSLFVVSAGSVVLEAKHPGSTAIEIHRVGVGGILCGGSMLSDHPNTESAVAEVDSTLLEIDAYTLHYLGESKPGVSRLLYQNLLRSRAVHFDWVMRSLARAQVEAR